MKKHILISIIVCCIVTLTGCSILQFSNLRNCKFAMAGIQNVTWAGINISQISSTRDLSISNMTNALTAIKNMDFTITCDVNVKTENPTNQMARLVGYDYELFLNDNTKPVATGSSHDKEYFIPANTTVIIPIPVKVDLVSVIKNKEVGSIIKCIKDIQDKGNGTSSDVKVKFTPYLSVGRTPVKLAPLTLTKSFQSSPKATRKTQKQTTTASPNKR